MTVITTQFEGQTHGMTANAFMSVSLVPPLVVVSVNNRAHMHRYLSTSQHFGVSVLAEDQEALSNHFAGSTFEGVQVPFSTRHGIPLLDGAVAHLVARVVETHTAGDHTLYFGEVEYLDWRDDKPLLFYAGRYHQLSKKQPKPTPWPEDEYSLFSIGNFNLPTS